MRSTVSNSLSLPAEREVQVARQGRHQLASYLTTRSLVQSIQIVDDKNNTHQVEVPTAALNLLVTILDQFASGNAVEVVPIHAELTTQEAANLLNVSRPYLIKLLEEGKLPFHYVGSHRRLFFEDVMAYKDESFRRSQEAMAEIVRLSQEMGLYDDL